METLAGEAPNHTEAPCVIDATDFVAPELRRYDSIDDLLWELWGPTFEGDGAIYGEDGDGNTIELSKEDYLKSLCEMGFYGFADRKNNTVHFWYDGKAETGRENLAYFFGHELGHILGTPCEDEMAEEHRANTYGAAVVQAMRWIEQLNA